MRYVRMLALFLGVVILLTITAPRDAEGCAILWRPNQSPIEMSAERTLIVWEPEYQTQHFIRAAEFRVSTTTDFGFMVPTPSQPELAEADQKVFAALEYQTKPRTVYQTIDKKVPCDYSIFESVGSAAPAPLASRAVQVLEQKSLGAYDAAVLKATDAAALNQWLAANGYQSRPALQTWLAEYIRQGWFITAFKMKPGLNLGNAVRMSFKTEKPIYPYREPEAPLLPDGASVPQRKLKLFMLAATRMAGKHNDPAETWAGTTVWAGFLKQDLFAELPKQIGIKDGERLRKDWYLTEFEDASSPRRGTDDLTFTISDDQSAKERPPVIVTSYNYVRDCGPFDVSISRMPVWAIVAGAVGVVLLLAGIIVIRKRRRAA